MKLLITTENGHLVYAGSGAGQQCLVMRSVGFGNVAGEYFVYGLADTLIALDAVKLRPCAVDANELAVTILEVDRVAESFDQLAVKPQLLS